MIEILAHNLGRYEMGNEVLETRLDISKTGKEMRIPLTTP